MTTYTKETALYNTDAIGSDIEGAGETAKSVITEVGTTGLKLHPSGQSGNNIVDYTLVNADGMEVFDGGESVASFGEDGARIGKAYVANANDNESHMELDYHSMQLIDKEGDTYFHVSDLRDANGWITDAFEGDGSTTAFPLTSTAVSPASNIVVTVNGSVVTSGITKQLTSVTFNTAPTSGAVINVKYEPSSAGSSLLKAYTLGKRMANRRIGIYSFVEGYGNDASGEYSHAEGLYSAAKGHRSHAEGSSIANATCAHAEGFGCVAGGTCGHAEGWNSSTGMRDYAHAQNLGTIALKKAQTTLGTYNVYDQSTTTMHPSGDTDYGKYAVILGNGTADDARSNALAVKWDGTVECASDTDWITLNSTIKYRIHHGVCYVVGTSTNVTQVATGGTVVGTLPTDARPTIDVQGAASTMANNSGQWKVGTNGQITVWGFNAATKYWTFTASYPL